MARALAVLSEYLRRHVVDALEHLYSRNIARELFFDNPFCEGLTFTVLGVLLTTPNYERGCACAYDSFKRSTETCV
jgi:hypothetical protein